MVAIDDKGKPSKPRDDYHHGDIQYKRPTQQTQTIGWQFVRS